MADNKLLLKRGADEDFLAEDDPLAELARIVGFDPAPVAKPVPLAQLPLAQRREPAFDLEDELLKELEIYAQPTSVERTVVAAEPAFAPTVESERPAEPEPTPEPEPEIVAAEPVMERTPVVLEAVETIADASDGRVYERPASHPVFDLEDEILREFAAFDARRVAEHTEQPLEVEVVRQDPADLAIVPAELHDVPDVRTAAPAPFAREQGREIYDSFRDDDLDAEIAGVAEPRLAPEAFVAPGDAAPQPDVAIEPLNAFEQSSSGPVDDGYWAELDDAAVLVPESDAASGQADMSHGDTPAELHRSPAEETVSTQPAMEEFAEPVADEPEIQNFADTLPHGDADASAPVDLQPALTPLEIQIPAQPVTSHDYGLDELLAEVEKYPVGDGAGRWGVQSKPVAVEETERAAAPLVEPVPTLHEPVDLAAEPQEMAAAADAEDIGDLSFDDSSFELDLGDIELDLSDLHDADFSVSPGLLTEIVQAPIAETPVEQAPVEWAPVEVEPVRAVRDEQTYRQPVSQAVDTDYSSLPFDPSQIGQEEEVVEAIAEMDVPEAPVVHEEERPAPHPEYDIDLDAEMAQLFATATASAVSQQRTGQTQDNIVGFGPVPARAPSGSLDLDEFERALEEDFRRSFSENQTGTNPDRVALAPAYDDRATARKSRGWMLMASAAVAIVLFGGAGVYAFMSGDARMMVSSEPKVILADTDPVKVVPDDPGGKQVPNQNKAVYDRVSGSKTDETRQESLLTSNEEPVDVVQRTLMPEALPMDEDVMTLTTPTGDTVDPRLLPDEAEQERVTTTNKVVSGVSPRKVKTMVVRPDGTLVEREVTEDDLKQQASNDAELMKIAQKAAQDAATASDSQGDDIAKAIENVPERLAPADDTTASAVTAEDDKTARVAEPDVTPEPVVDPIDAASVEVVPVADEAAESVQKTELKPTEAAVEDKPVERSIAVDSQSPAIDESAVADAADAEVEDAPVRKVKTTKIAPVPENRPVDQPVTVVGTVTDQGTVRSDAEAKTQEVALANQTAQTPAETTPLPAGSYVIQIASLPSEAEAQTSYSRLSAKFAGIIGGRGVDIRKAEIKNKGTYYRVRIPAGSKQEAQALCADYKRAGGSCLVSK